MRILLIEDDLETFDDFISEAEKNFIIDIARNGVDGSMMAASMDYDAIVIDSSVVDMETSEICRMTRSQNTKSPIVVTESPRTKKDKLSNFEAGADTHLSKPLSPAELNAQINALIRLKASNQHKTLFRLGKLTIDLCDQTVIVGTKQLKLRRKEFELLEYLVLHMGKVVSKEELLDHIWEKGTDVESNTLEVHVKHLRDKFRPVLHSEVIKTVRGFGYIISKTYDKHTLPNRKNRPTKTVVKKL